jgi:integrase
MASVVRGLWRHQNGFWYFSRMRDGVKKTIALGTQDQQEAMRRALAVVDHPALALAGDLAAEIEAFIAFKLARDEYSRFSAENKRLTLRRFARWIGEDSVIRRVRSEDLQRFYDEERRRVTESTAQGYMMCLRSFFAWLHRERKVIGANPAEGLSMGRWDYGARVEFCSPEVRDALLGAWSRIPATFMARAQAREIGFVMHAGFEAGLRKNEIIECRPDWFNLPGRSIRVQRTATFRPKDREARSIPLTDVFLAFLERHPPRGEWCLAPECVRGKSRYRYDFKRPFERYVEWTGRQIGQDLGWVTAHTMRHTFASLLACAGESLHKISVWLGDDPRVVDRHYAHLRDGDRAINALHSFASGPRPSTRRSPPEKSASSRPGTRRRRTTSGDWPAPSA